MFSGQVGSRSYPEPGGEEGGPDFHAVHHDSNFVKYGKDQRIDVRSGQRLSICYPKFG